MSNNKRSGFFAGKGYYIALILCAVTIGISGYMYYRNATSNEPQLQDPTSDAGVVDPTNNDLPVVGTNPGTNPGDSLQEPKPTTPDVPETFQTSYPLQGETISDYAMDCLAYNETTRDWRVHDGIDIAAEAGTKVCAAAAGTVYSVYQDEMLGSTVVIRHDNGYMTVYSSLSEDTLVSPGDRVTMGQAIGYVGNTALLECSIGDHLHFAVTKDGKSVDPEKFLES